MTWFKRFIVAPLGRACRWLGARGRITVPLRAAWIIFVYYVSIVLVLLTLGAHQLQSELTDELEGVAALAAKAEAEAAEARVAGPPAPRELHGLGELLAQALELRALEFALLAAQRRFSATGTEDDEMAASEALIAYRSFAAGFTPTSLTAMEQVNSFVGLGPLTLGFVNPAGVLGIHPTVLTLVLTLVMGVLGTTISVTSQFFKAPREKSLAWYVFRPGLGMVTALAIYVAFRAGQMGLTGGDNDSELNPFVISFFAIAAGLVSEEAIEQLSRLGRGLFGAKAPVGDAVLAKDLGAALTAKGTTPEELAQELGTTSEQVESWIARDERVPLREQRRIADLLGRPPGELFEPLT